jgi:hypothetical protein
MKAPAKTFGSPEGEPNTTTNSPTPQQMCEKLWTLPSAGVQLKVHQRVHDSAVGRLLKPCPCGGRFNDAALPRCPYCRHILSPILATHYIEANAPGAKKGWRWQKSWDGIYSIVIENEAVQDWWKIQ